MKLRIVALLVVGAAAIALIGMQRLAKPPVVGLFDTAPTIHTEQLTAMTAKCLPSQTVPATGGIVGIQVAGITSLDDPRVLASLLELKPTWVRLELLWSEIERPDGTYDWSRTDNLFRGLAENDINVLAVVNYVPNHVKDWDTAAQRLEQFLTEAVNRYKPNGTLTSGGGVSYWQIFNEPNLPGYGWGHQAMNAETFIPAYALLAATANKTIHTNDPEAVVVLAGMSPDGFEAKTYWDELYTLGMKDCFDVLAFHPYGYIGRLAALEIELEQYLESRSDAGKTVWFSELGTTDDDARGDQLTAVATERSNFNALMWLSLQDLGRARGKNFGLLTLDFEPKADFKLFYELFGQKQ